MTAQHHQNPDEFVWFVSRWLVVAMLGHPDAPERLGTNSGDRRKNGALTKRRTSVIDATCIEDVT